MPAALFLVMRQAAVLVAHVTTPSLVLFPAPHSARASRSSQHIRCYRRGGRMSRIQLHPARSAVSKVVVSCCATCAACASCLSQGPTPRTDVEDRWQGPTEAIDPSRRRDSRGPPLSPLSLSPVFHSTRPSSTQPALVLALCDSVSLPILPACLLSHLAASFSACSSSASCGPPSLQRPTCCAAR